MGKPKGKRAATGIRHGEPEVRHAEGSIDHGRYPKTYKVDPRFWPAHEPLPTVYEKPRRRPQPCPHCRRVLLDNGGRAVACQSSGAELAWFRCRACDKRWSLPVKRA